MCKLCHRTPSHNSGVEWLTGSGDQVLALIQSVLVHLAVNHGLGRHRNMLSLGDYSYYSKVGPGLIKIKAPLMMLRLMVGRVYQSNTQDLCPLSGKTHPSPCIPTVNALEANAAYALVICLTSNTLGLCGHHHLQYPVSAPETMGPLRGWLP